jgi:hypothetical protein
MNPTAAIHVAKKQLGLDDDTYRAVLVRVTGVSSSRDMSPAQRQAVLDEMRRLGFEPAAGARSNGARKPLEGPFARKLQALWIAAWNLGLVRDRRDEALSAFVRRQTGIDHVSFLRDAADGKKAIEALKGWLARDGGVQWGTSNGYDFLTHDAGKIAWAQFRKLVPGATLMGNQAAFYREVKTLVPHIAYDGMPLGLLKPADWRTVMNAFGERVRRGKGVIGHWREGLEGR